MVAFKKSIILFALEEGQKSKMTLNIDFDFAAIICTCISILLFVVGMTRVP